MDFSFPASTEKLGKERIDFLRAFKTACKRTILEELRTSQSGHPGGSLSSLDILSVLYAFQISRTNEKIVISNGHISAGVYAVLAEMGAINRKKLVSTYRQFGSIFEGHLTRHVAGVWYGTGPLGIGVSAATGFAVAEKKKASGQTVFCLMGDGEIDEGQVHEMALFAGKEKLDNLVVLVDYNRVQLSGSLESVMPLDPVGFFKTKNWKVLEIDGHDPEAIWEAIHSPSVKGRPLAIIAKTIMGKGISALEEEGSRFKSTWHGKAPEKSEIDVLLGGKELRVTEEELRTLEDFRQKRNFVPAKPKFTPDLETMKVSSGVPILYNAGEMTDCRTAYGKALLDLAKHNKNILALTADLGGSVMTKFVASELPAQFLECGICEQNMVTVSGALSLSDFVPFCSSFGAFLTSRSRDQARVNDINRTNVKMVATHCGLSVGQDGPTHQSIDDMGSMASLLHTHVAEPADPNHCDRIIRYIATHYGNFYVRMGRVKLPVLLKENGSVLFGADYEYEDGKMEVLRKGTDISIVAMGACVHEALAARESFKNPDKIEIVIASSNKKFDQTLEKSVKKTGRVITVEDHNNIFGLGSSVAKLCAEKGISLKSFHALGVEEYQLSGQPAELYKNAGIDREGIRKAIKEELRK